jgi:hypothetical protein
MNRELRGPFGHALLELVVRTTQRFFRLLACGDVSVDRDIPDKPVIGVAKCHHRSFHVRREAQAFQWRARSYKTLSVSFNQRMDGGAAP